MVPVTQARKVLSYEELSLAYPSLSYQAMVGPVESGSSFIYFMYFSIRYIYIYTTLVITISCVLEKDKMRKGERESPIDSQAKCPVIQSMGHVRSKMVQQSHPGLSIIPVFAGMNLPPLLPRRRKCFYCKQSRLLGCTPVSLFFLSKSSGFSRVKHVSSRRGRDKQNHGVPVKGQEMRLFCAS